MSEYTCGYDDGKGAVFDELMVEITSLREQLKDCSAAFDRQQEQLDRNAEQLAALRKDASSKWAFLEWRDRAEKAEAKNAALHQCLRNVYEVWAGSEGIPAPTVASEAYLLSLVEQMRDAAKEGLK